MLSLQGIPTQGIIDFGIGKKPQLLTLVIRLDGEKNPSQFKVNPTKTG